MVEKSKKERLDEALEQYKKVAATAWEQYKKVKAQIEKEMD